MILNITNRRLRASLSAQAGRERISPEAVINKALLAYLARQGHRLATSEWTIPDGDVEDRVDLLCDGRVVAYDLSDVDHAIEVAKGDREYLPTDTILRIHPDGSAEPLT